jgi:hypothetical protein
MSRQPQPQPQRVQLGPPGHYILPLVESCGWIGFPEGELPVHIHCYLEGGYELDVPVSREGIDDLVRVLAPYLPKKE